MHNTRRTTHTTQGCHHEVFIKTFTGTTWGEYRQFISMKTDDALRGLAHWRDAKTSPTVVLDGIRYWASYACLNH